jgi:chromosome segregation ATPase
MEYLDDDFEEMEMPTPCQKCDEWFDLHTGVASKKWFPKTTICENCGELEDDEIDLDEEIEDLKETISEAEDSISTAKERLKELKAEGYV